MNISCDKVKTDLNTGGDSSLLNGGRLLKTITVDTTQQLFAQVHIIKIVANLEKSVGIIIKYLYCSVFINLCIFFSGLFIKFSYKSQTTIPHASLSQWFHPHSFRMARHIYLHLWTRPGPDGPHSNRHF